MFADFDLSNHVPATFERFNPVDPVAYVLSENIVRRHLTPGQRAMIAEKLANLRDGVRSDRANQAVGIPTATREKAAALVGTTPQAISQARAVKEWAPAAAKAIEAGKISLEAGCTGKAFLPFPFW